MVVKPSRSAPVAEAKTWGGGRDDQATTVSGFICDRELADLRKHFEAVLAVTDRSHRLGSRLPSVTTVPSKPYKDFTRSPEGHDFWTFRRECGSVVRAVGKSGTAMCAGWNCRPRDSP